jgi:hypothetical protein
MLDKVKTIYKYTLNILTITQETVVEETEITEGEE